MDLSKFHNLSIVLLAGNYGAGKTEFSIKFFKGTDRCRLSRSEIRRHIHEMTNFGDPWTPDQFSEGSDSLVKHIERKIVEQFIHDKKKILVVNTFMTKKSRSRFLEIARENKRSIGIIFLNRPLEQCFEKNEKNPFPVPREVINSLSTRIEIPQKNEGFDEVLILNFK